MSGKCFNAIILVTCKYSKRITLVLGKVIESEEEWAWALLSRLEPIDWGFLAGLISDRDPKFLIKLYAALFIKLEVELLYPTVYHPQTDGSNKKTNQIVRIILCFFVHAIPNLHEWLLVSPKMQSLLNNTLSSITRKSPYKIVYGFTLKQLLDMLILVAPQDQSETKTAVYHTILFASMIYKNHFDYSHQPLFLKIRKYTLLHLHKSYSIPSTIRVTKKPTQQYVRHLKCLKK